MEGRNTTASFVGERKLSNYEPPCHPKERRDQGFVFTPTITLNLTKIQETQPSLASVRSREFRRGPEIRFSIPFPESQGKGTLIHS